MTGKEIQIAKNTLPQLSEMSPEQRVTFLELTCREMINSCLIYNQERLFYDVNTGKFGMYAENYLDLGETKLLQLFNEQKQDVARSTILRGVHVDAYGVVYNSIIWNDEQ